MSCEANIAAALRACQPCPASPPARRWVLADRISSDRAAPGRQVDVRLGSVPQRDSRGRIAHVRGIYFSASATFTVPAAFVGATARELRGIFQAMMLEDITGHSFFPSIDARVLLDDVYFRHGANIAWPLLKTGTQGPGAYQPTATADNGIAAAATPGATERSVAFYFPFTTLGPGADPLAGLLPLAALQRQSNEGSIRFRIGQSPLSVPSLPCTGLVDGQGNAGMDVWLDLVYLDALAVGPSWTLDSYTIPDSSGILRRPEASTELAVVRFQPEDEFGGNGGFASADDLDLATLIVAGFTEFGGYSKDDLRTRTGLYAMERDGATVRANAAQDLPLFSNGALPLYSDQSEAIVLLPYRQRGKGEASGDVSYRFGSMGGLSNIRFLHRTVDCNEADRASQIAQAAKCSPNARAVMCDPSGQPAAIGSKKGTVLVLNT